MGSGDTKKALGNKIIVFPEEPPVTLEIKIISRISAGYWSQLLCIDTKMGTLFGMGCDPEKERQNDFWKLFIVK